MSLWFYIVLAEYFYTHSFILFGFQVLSKRRAWDTGIAPQLFLSTSHNFHKILNSHLWYNSCYATLLSWADILYVSRFWELRGCYIQDSISISIFLLSIGCHAFPYIQGELSENFIISFNLNRLWCSVIASQVWLILGVLQEVILVHLFIQMWIWCEIGVKICVNIPESTMEFFYIYLTYLFFSVFLGTNKFYLEIPKLC
jgi:hypothetical protein